MLPQIWGAGFIELQISHWWIHMNVWIFVELRNPRLESHYVAFTILGLYEDWKDKRSDYRFNSFNTACNADITLCYWRENFLLKMFVHGWNEDMALCFWTLWLCLLAQLILYFIVNQRKWDKYPNPFQSEGHFEPISISRVYPQLPAFSVIFIIRNLVRRPLNYMRYLRGFF